MPCRTQNGKQVCTRTNWWREAMGIDWYSGSGGSQPPAFDADYQALLTQATLDGVTLPDADTQARQNILMIQSKASGYHAKRAAYWIMCNDPNAVQFSTYNWKDPTKHRLTLEGLVGGWLGSHSALGFTGGAANSNNYIRTHFNLSSDGAGLYTQDSAGIDFHLSDFNAGANGAVCGVRNAAATAQLIVVARSTSAGVVDNTRYMINDNTNTELTANVQTRGQYMIERPSATQKQAWRRSIQQAAQTLNSVTVPDGELFLLARNSLSTSTIDAFSSHTISQFGIGAPLTAGEKQAWRNAYLDYYLSQQLPLFTLPVGTGTLFYKTGSSGWDAGSVFGEARYNDTLIYGGTDEAGDDPGNYNVGAAAVSGVDVTKDAGNPVLDAGTIAGLTSIFPMNSLVIGDTIYWLCSVREDEIDKSVDTAIFTSPVSDPTNLTFVSRIISAGGTGRFNHGAHFFDNPADTTRHHIVYSHRNDPTVQMRINIARCLKSDDITDPANWSVLHSNIVAIPPNVSTNANIGQVYPLIIHDGGNFKMLYGKFFAEQQANSFTIFSTQSSNLSSFPVGKETLWPTGVDGDEDKQYTTLPDIYGTRIFYGARVGGSETPYTSRLWKSFTKNY